jgi:hypothetical protein
MSPYFAKLYNAFQTCGLRGWFFSTNHEDLKDLKEQAGKPGKRVGRPILLCGVVSPFRLVYNRSMIKD